jgi:CRISPR/Cas system-associated endoribonuclease Cas2
LIFFSIPFFKFQKPAVKKTFEKFQSLVLIKVFLFILTDKSLTWKQNSVFKSKLKDVDVLLVHKIIYRHIIIYSFLKGRYTLCIMIIQLEVAFVARSTDVMGVLIVAYSLSDSEGLFRVA